MGSRITVGIKLRTAQNPPHVLDPFPIASIAEHQLILLVLHLSGMFGQIVQGKLHLARCLGQANAGLHFICQGCVFHN